MTPSRQFIPKTLKATQSCDRVTPNSIQTSFLSAPTWSDFRSIDVQWQPRCYVSPDSGMKKIGRVMAVTHEIWFSDGPMVGSGTASSEFCSSTIESETDYLDHHEPWWQGSRVSSPQPMDWVQCDTKRAHRRCQLKKRRNPMTQARRVQASHRVIGWISQVLPAVGYYWMPRVVYGRQSYCELGDDGGKNTSRKTFGKTN